MTRRDPRLARLQALAEMIKSRELARTASLKAACTQTQARIETLRLPAPWAEDPALFRARQAHLLWAKAEQTRLISRLALQTARLEDQKTRTARALGRADVLGRIASVTR